jgi:5-methylcytosine-specific restriction protein B
MMAEDESRFPPVQATPIAKAYELTGVAAGGLTEIRRYYLALTFFQRVMDEAAARGWELRDLLEAQSVTWVIAKMDPPPEWDPPTRRAFLVWRGDEQPTEEPTEDTDLPRSEQGNGEEVSPDPDLQSLAKSLYLPEEFLQETIDLLRERGQIVLYGPPGTGKTYVARAIARYLSADRFEVVQFHPSYSYEDFVWGYRPVEVDGTLSYELTPGPLMRLADRARGSDAPYVLVIDEINRGNLPKILGELLYLLEYRKDRVELMYSRPSDEPFSLPGNLLIIGTMNTADRSVGLIDAALRRRFHFVPLFPGRDPLVETLRSWLQDNRPSMVHVADLVDSLNAKLTPKLGPHLQLGHSHFFRQDLDEDVLAQIWRYDVTPFIEDQLYGHEDQLTEFSLTRLAEELDANHPTPGVDADDGASDA